MMSYENNESLGLYYSGEPSKANVEIYKGRCIDKFLDDSDGKPAGMRCFFKFEGTFLLFGPHITRATLLPGVAMTTKNIMDVCRNDPRSAALVAAWRHLFIEKVANFPAEVAAFNFWDMPMQERNLLFMRLDQIKCDVISKLTPEMESKFFDELSKANEINMPYLDSGVAFDLVRSVPQLPSLVEVAASAFVNNAGTREDIRELLSTEAHDPPEVTSFKVEVIHQSLKGGMINPEVSLFKCPTGIDTVDALVFNDGYRDYMSRVAQLKMRDENAPAITLRRFRPGLFAYYTHRDHVMDHRMIRIYLFYCEEVNGVVEFSVPEISEYFRNGPSPMYDQLMYPMMFTFSSFTTGLIVYPMMNIFCYTPRKQRVFPNIYFYGDIKIMLALIYQAMRPPSRDQLPLPVDVLRLIITNLSPRDVINFMSISRNVRALVAKAYFPDSNDILDKTMENMLAARITRSYAAVSLYVNVGDAVMTYWTFDHMPLYNVRIDNARLVLPFTVYKPTSLSSLKGTSTKAFLPRKRIRQFSKNNVYVFKRRRHDDDGNFIVEILRVMDDDSDPQIRAIVEDSDTWDVPDLDFSDEERVMSPFEYRNPIPCTSEPIKRTKGLGRR